MTAPLLTQGERRHDAIRKKMYGKDQNGGIYIHVPFCMKKCRYCDFYSETDSSMEPAFVAAVKKEMEKRAEGGLLFDTLYLGGGTPSLLAPASIGDIIETARKNYSMAEDVEITMEVNPGTVDPGRLREFQSLGINRINIGIQSFDDGNLSFLGRIHTAEEALDILAAARSAGFSNIGLDLIYGIPGQTRASWERDLETATEFSPEHLSCYMLTYESGTPLEKALRKGSFRALSEERVRSLFETTAEFLHSRGYFRYEVSNFAPSYALRSRHNRKYWTFAPYLGFGPSAHSFSGNRRSWNLSLLKEYMDVLEKGGLPVEEEEELTREQLMIEAVYLGLRTTDGIPVPAFEKMFGVNFMELFGRVLTGQAEKGMVSMENDRCFLTEKGMLFLDSITSLFVGCDF